MGLVETFTAAEKMNSFSPHSLAFNNPTDKLMCGIIPGASFLVERDFYCTDDSGQTDVLKAVLNVTDSTDWLRQHLDMQLGEPSDRDHTRWKDTLSNEITAMLCEFLPYDGAKDHIFSGWKEGISGLAMCPLSSTQLFNAVLDYVRDYTKPGRGMVAKDVYDQMSQLVSAEDDERRMQYTQRVFERTTLWFVTHEFDHEYHGQTLYLHLVAAHCNLSFKAWKSTTRLLRNPKLDNTFPSRTVYDQKIFSTSNEASSEENETLPKVAEVDGREYRWKGKFPTAEVELELLASMYLKEIHVALEEYCNHGARLYNVHLPHKYLDHMTLYHDAWFVMMLRGFAWFLLKNKFGKLQTVRSGEAIPSSCWDNPRPVWIV